jgi:3-dehydroquinate synthase
VRAKAAIVAQDERETTGRRALLNLGHTFGHALEAETGFSDRLLHGEAVALGMALAFRFSARRGLCAPAHAERVEAHLAAAGLPTRLDIGTPATLVEHMRADKKAAGGRVPFILARGIGEAFVDHSVELDDVDAFLASELG